MDNNENAISWFEIPATDINRAKSFYEKIFQFEMGTMDVGDGVKMAIFPHQQSVGGALVQYPDFYKPSHNGALIYLNAGKDLKKVEDRVNDAGGQVIIEKRMISPDHGYMAVIEDSEGNRVALHSVS